MASKKILVAVGLLALVALAAAGPPLDKKEKNQAAAADRKAAAEARRAEFDKKVGDKRWGGNTRPHEGVSGPAAVDALLSCTPHTPFPSPPTILSCGGSRRGRVAEGGQEQRASREEASV